MIAPDLEFPASLEFDRPYHPTKEDKRKENLGQMEGFSFIFSLPERELAARKLGRHWISLKKR